MSTEDASLDSYRVILGTFDGFDHYSLGSLLFEKTSKKPSKLHVNDIIEEPTLFVVDSCNGLILLQSISDDLFLWNPTIKKAKKLPSIETETLRKHYSGFGFDESNDDYKVATIVRSTEVDYERFNHKKRKVDYEHNYLTDMKSSVNIYSLKTDCWKMFGDLKGEIVGGDIKFLNGKFHWGAWSVVGTKVKWFIVSLDLESEVYETVDQPDYGEGPEGKFESTVGLMGGCICVFRNFGDWAHIRQDLWVLKEYGLTESWSKVFEYNWWKVIPRALFLCGEYEAPLYSQLLSMLPNGEILLGSINAFVIYNPKNNSFRHIHTHDHKIYKFKKFGSIFYVESLVSPVTNGRLQCEATSLKKEEKVDFRVLILNHAGSRPDSGLELSSRFPISAGLGLILI